MLEKNMKELEKYIKAPDISSRELIIDNKKIIYIYIESVCSDNKISEFILKSMTYDVKINNYFNLLNTIPNAKVKKIENINEAIYYLQNGFTIILTDNDILVLETKSKIDRGVNISSNENVIRGPKDSFNENYMTNIGLIRKRIKDDKLTIEESIVGRRTKTKVALIYINDIAK